MKTKKQTKKNGGLPIETKIALEMKQGIDDSEIAEKLDIDITVVIKIRHGLIPQERSRTAAKLKQLGIRR